MGELEELLELKEKTQALYFKRRNSKLGEFYTQFLCLTMNCMNDGINCVHVFLLWLHFRNS